MREGIILKEKDKKRTDREREKKREKGEEGFQKRKSTPLSTHTHPLLFLFMRKHTHPLSSNLTFSFHNSLTSSLLPIPIIHTHSHTCP
jgi:hypothetical protein